MESYNHARADYAGMNQVDIQPYICSPLSEKFRTPGDAWDWDAIAEDIRLDINELALISVCRGDLLSMRSDFSMDVVQKSKHMRRWDVERCKLGVAIREDD